MARAGATCFKAVVDYINEHGEPLTKTHVIPATLPCLPLDKILYYRWPVDPFGLGGGAVNALIATVAFSFFGSIANTF